jgi:hypothetical protein
MTKSTIFVLAAVFALAASQDGSGDQGGGGGGGGQDDPGWTGSEKQITGKHCGQLTKDDCTFIDEARLKCPQTCTNRDNGETPAAETQPPGTKLPCIGGPKKCGGKKKGCFHGDDVVQTKEHGTITMSKLAELRDAHVLTRNDDGELEYSRVRCWLHSQPQVNMKFHMLRTESGHRLAITGEHLIYETDCRGGQARAIYAKNVQLDRCLYVKNADGKLSESRIVEKGQEKMTGIYSPITVTGSIVVNDVLASCYSYYENESLQKFVYQIMIGCQDALANWLPSSLYEAAFNSQHGAVVAVPRLVLTFLNLSNYFVY